MTSDAERLALVARLWREWRVRADAYHAEVNRTNADYETAGEIAKEFGLILARDQLEEAMDALVSDVLDLP